MKVIALDINNLTDARYFAAYMVDSLGFHLDPSAERSVDDQRLTEILEWVEGPDTIVVFDGLEVSSEAASIVDKHSISKAVVGPFIDIQSLPNSIETVIRKCTLSDGWHEENSILLSLDKPYSELSNEVRAQIETISESRVVYLDGLFSVGDLPSLIKSNIEGIAVKGSDEEKVGYKSYEELDDLFDALLDINTP